MKKIILILLFNASVFPVIADDAEQLLCTKTGLANVEFGRVIEHEKYEIFERADSGVTYYWYKPGNNISPFTHMLVGVSPISRQVFTISLEKYGAIDELEDIIPALKQKLSRHHNTLRREQSGYQHYARQVEGLEMTIYRMGKFMNGKGTYVLSYSCTSKQQFKLMWKEALDSMRNQGN